MKLLLDEDVPRQLLETLRCVLVAHTVAHIDELGWKSKTDQNLLADAASKGYQAFLTNDSKQLDSAVESRAIRDSGMHHIRYRQQTGRGERAGVTGLALAMGAILAAICQVMRELDAADGQRLVLIQSISYGTRHETRDPRKDPPPYWPSRVGQPSRPSRNRKP